MERRRGGQGFRVKVLACLRQLGGLLNQFCLSCNLDAFRSSYDLVLSTYGREKLFWGDSKKCNKYR